MDLSWPNSVPRYAITIMCIEYYILKQPFLIQISRRARGTVKDRINLDVHTVDELRKQGVPSTNDKPKYHYTSDDQGNNCAL